MDALPATPQNHASDQTRELLLSSHAVTSEPLPTVAASTSRTIPNSQASHCTVDRPAIDKLR